jgi:hypothetical protein
MSGERLELILEQCGVHPKFWPEMKALVLHGERPGRELLTRLFNVANYKAAYDTILAELSRQSPHKFPPPVSQFQSLEVSA